MVSKVVSQMVTQVVSSDSTSRVAAVCCRLFPLPDFGVQGALTHVVRSAPCLISCVGCRSRVLASPTSHAPGCRFREMRQGAAATLHPLRSPFARSARSRGLARSRLTAPRPAGRVKSAPHVCCCGLLAVIVNLFGLAKSWHGRSLRQGKTLRVPPCLRACGRAGRQAARTGHLYSFTPIPCCTRSSCSTASWSKPARARRLSRKRSAS